MVRYEYTPGFEELDALSVGAQGHYWFGERVKVGLTANSNDEGDTDSGLEAADVTRADQLRFVVQAAGRADRRLPLERRCAPTTAASASIRLRRCVVRRRGCRRLSRRRELRVRRLLRRRARPRHALHAELGRRLRGAGPADADGHRELRRHVPDAASPSASRCARSPISASRSSGSRRRARAQRRLPAQRQLGRQHGRAHRRAPRRLARSCR